MTRPTHCTDNLKFLPQGNGIGQRPKKIFAGNLLFQALLEFKWGQVDLGHFIPPSCHSRSVWCVKIGLWMSFITLNIRVLRANVHKSFYPILSDQWDCCFSLCPLRGAGAQNIGLGSPRTKIVPWKQEASLFLTYLPYFSQQLQLVQAVDNWYV